MDYNFEGLDEHRFQQLCQALLVKEHPDVQCFPLNQSDGGRDAIMFQRHVGEKAFLVYQVKFVQRPLVDAVPHRKLAEALEEEIPKLSQLIPKGAKGYYLLTNVPGTGQPDRGSIDKVQRLLSGAIAIPSMCWWRDDISRRLDDAFDLKWAYPEVMRTADLLRVIVEKHLSDNAERRMSALKAFLRAQYARDEEVRFKQVDLRNRLIDLFVDVPIRAPGPGDPIELQVAWNHSRRQCGLEEGDALGAIALLLDTQFRGLFPHVVIYGAPGQGKSTLAQYLCQIYRGHLLNEKEFIAALPQEHRPVQMRVPFKVDLRDFATWLSRKDPFSSDERNILPQGWERSLESFLAAQIRHLSGGADFSVSDLHAILKLSAALLVLDGLDEVADIDRREEVVREVRLAVRRISDVAASVQVVITSRPTALSGASSFPEYPHFSLGSLHQQLIIEYADRWIKAKALDSTDASNVKHVLRKKIELPHLRDLARNPMQLAILLSLIHTRGFSLPDKRTALYDGYVELFFNREAEKSRVVRDHRDLLISLHQYFAWILHSEAEKGEHRGSISSDRLQSLLQGYLVAEDSENTSVADLFKGMVERIVFLVARVEGMYEFEVQPLREYFVAKYLYETAPYSPTGAECPGTKPDRFDAIAPNPYWSNVTRFFAGCFSKGELPCLLDRLLALNEKQDYTHTSYARRLTGTLLADWVFSQDQRTTKKAMSFILEGLESRLPLARPRREMGEFAEEPLSLPPKCGGEELANLSFGVLRSFPQDDYAFEMTRVIRANGTHGSTVQRWLSSINSLNDQELSKWLMYAIYLGVVPNVTPKELENALGSRRLLGEHLQLLVVGRQSVFVQACEERYRAFVEDVLAGNSFSFLSQHDILSRFANALSPSQYQLAFRHCGPISLKDVLARFQMKEGSSFSGQADMITSRQDGLLQKCLRLVEVAEAEQSALASEWASEIRMWSTIVEESRRLFGENWVSCVLANSAAGISSSSVTCADYPNLLDHTQPLCERVRHARLRSGAHRWWESQFDHIRTELDRRLVLLVFCTWASMSTICKLSDRLEQVLAAMEEADWLDLFTRMRSVPARRPRQPVDRKLNVAGVGERVLAVIALKVRESDSLWFCDQYLQHYDGTEYTLLWYFVKTLLEQVYQRKPPWSKLLDAMAKMYDHNTQDWLALPQSRVFMSRIPLSVAQSVLSKAARYPRAMVYLAEEKWMMRLQKRVARVADAAAQGNWFMEANT